MKIFFFFLLLVNSVYFLAHYQQPTVVTTVNIDPLAEKQILLVTESVAKETKKTKRVIKF
ncbi:MAG: hypothetical protein Q9M50_03945 [Methylococcales bacterium]|nr:hypothetical protein [Methylococcales bacterium]